jgi:hypothetical protein
VVCLSSAASHVLERRLELWDVAMKIVVHRVHSDIDDVAQPTYTVDGVFVHRAHSDSVDYITQNNNTHTHTFKIEK